FILFSANISLIWEIVFVFALGLLGGVLLSQFSRRRRAQGRGQPADGVGDLGRRGKAEGEARRLPAAAAPREEVRPRDERDPGGLGPGQELDRVDGVGKVEPEEVTALGPVPLGTGSAPGFVRRPQSA